MGRRPREQTEGSLQHITVRGNRGLPIFVDNADRRAFVGALSHSGQLTGWSLLSYCLMRNHAHLLVRVGAGGLSVGMHSLTTRHAHRFNAAHGTSGHLFERRFHTSVIRHDAHLLESFRYIALNPWRAGVTDDRDLAAARPASPSRASTDSGGGLSFRPRLQPSRDRSSLRPQPGNRVPTPTLDVDNWCLAPIIHRKPVGAEGGGSGLVGRPGLTPSL